MSGESKLRGQVALVTGASRGIGRAVATGLAEEGMKLILLARDLVLLQQVRETCEQLGSAVHIVSVDLTDTAAVELAVQQGISKFGQIDVLVNVAGIGRRIHSLQADWCELMEMVDVNLKSVMHLTHTVLPHLVATRGSLIFIASVSAKYVYSGGAAYCASKHGVLGYAGCIFEDVRGHGVKVSTICPGFVATGMGIEHGANPREVIQPSAVADAVKFVARFPSSGCPTEIILRSQTPPWL